LANKEIEPTKNKSVRMSADKPFDYSTKESRENTVAFLFALAQSQRREVETRWEENKRYYEAMVGSQTSDDYDDDEEQRETSSSNVLRDAFIHIESQLDPTLPGAEFRGRDGDIDSEKAKQREYVVKYIAHINDLEGQNSLHERQLLIYGDAFQKVYYDSELGKEKGKIGDCVVKTVLTDDIFPDPSALCDDDLEYIDYVRYIHQNKVDRMFAEELAEAKMTAREFGTSTRAETEIEELSAETAQVSDFTVQVLEHWYKDQDGKINCSIQINGKEIKHIENYWENTWKQNNRFPFNHTWRIKKVKSYWNAGEIDPIKNLIDKADKFMETGLLNQELMSNDIIICDEGALADDAEISNKPGAIIMTKTGMSGGVRRLGGLQTFNNTAAEIQFIQGQIERTVRNYDTNQGRETTRVTTASGLAQIRADQQSQSNMKNYDRMQGYKRLYELIDMTALEFYDDDRMIYIGVPAYHAEQGADIKGIATPMKPLGEIDQSKGLIQAGMGKGNGLSANMDSSKGDIYFTFNSKDHYKEVPGQDSETEEKTVYVPRVDVIISPSNALAKNKAFTIETLSNLLNVQLTPQNATIYKELVRELELPQSADIIREVDKTIQAIEQQRIAQEKLAQEQAMAQQSQVQKKLDPATESAINQLPKEQQALIRSNPKLIEEAVKASQIRK